MKTNIYLNDYLTAYYRPIPDTSRLNHISFDVLTKLSSLDSKFIFRGESTVCPYLYETLDLFKDKDYILTTDATNPDTLINYKGKIPYLVIKYDGYMNDTIRKNHQLSYNLKKILDHFKNTNTILRFEYVISAHNISWLKLDLDIMRNYLELFPKMKQPYFLLYQKADIFNEQNFSWVSLGKDAIDIMNTKNILTQKTLTSLNAWYNKTTYKCISPQNEIVVWYDGTLRLCQSLRCKEVIGDLNIDDISIIEQNVDIRRSTEDCPYREQCWLFYHYKDNIVGEQLEL